MATRENSFLREMEAYNFKAKMQMMILATNDNAMDFDTPPGCSTRDFKRPRLRRCPHDFSSVVIRGPLNKVGRGFDGGLDGYNYKISFERGGPVYVMKVLWDPEPRPPHYFAPQRECQNAALFQMMQAAVSTTEPGPILINPDPKTYSDAVNNFAAFSDERRAKKAKQLAEGATFPGFVPVTSMPRMRRCHGWMLVRGHELLDRLPRGRCLPTTQVDYKMRRQIERELEYTAIIYEYVEQGANDPDVCQPVLDFLWRAGFQFAPCKLEKNWQSGILLDHSEIVHCMGYGWMQELDVRADWSRIAACARLRHETTIPYNNEAKEQDTATERSEEAE